MLLSPFGELFLSIIIQHCREELKEIKKNSNTHKRCGSQWLHLYRRCWSFVALKNALACHSPFCSLSYDRSIASSKTSFPHTLQSSAPSFDFQHPLFSLRSSRSCLWQVHSVFKDEFPTHCNLVLPLSISSILSFP